MASEQILLVFAGALIGGLVNGLTGFGTGLTAMGIWLYAISPPVAASLVVICSFVAQVLTFPMMWRSIEWRRVLPFIPAGVLGVPLGAWLLPQVNATCFKLGVGLFLIGYPLYVLAKKSQQGTGFGGRVADRTVGFASGVLGGLAGLSGPLLIIWTDVRGWTKDQRRSVLQGFNITILFVALATHALAGLITSEVGFATAVALPGTIGGAWIGARIYMKLGDRGYQQLVMILLLIAGLTLVWTSLY
jgi:uncharacterized protein